MSRKLFIALSAVVVLVVAAQTAQAQFQGGYYMGSSDNPVGPTVSPYLNLLQTNGNNITNYQSLVKPLLETNSALQRQASSINYLQQQQQAQSYGRGVGGRGTGHTTYFMNYSHFYGVPGR